MEAEVCLRFNQLNCRCHVSGVTWIIDEIVNLGWDETRNLKLFLRPGGAQE